MSKVCKRPLKELQKYIKRINESLCLKTMFYIGDEFLSHFEQEILLAGKFCHLFSFYHLPCSPFLVHVKETQATRGL